MFLYSILLPAEIELCRCCVKDPLERFDVGRIMFFRCLDAGVTEQQLDRPQVFSLLQKPNREGIPETVRMSLNARVHQQP